VERVLIGSPNARATSRPASRVPGVPFVTLAREHAQIAAELTSAFERVLGASAFILGEEVEAFEAEWAAACGTAHCIGVSSGTAALTVLLEAIGIGPGDEVLVPAHTFVATALAVIAAGAVPVLVDVEDGTGLVDLDAAEAAVGPRTTAVMPVHLYGQLCQMPALQQFAERHGLALVEDAAQAHGATFEGRAPGGFGAGAAFSFYPSKNLGALGDAGAICTDDPAVAERARMLRNLGQRRKGEHLVPGANQRLDGLQAAFLRIKLPRLERATAARRAHAARYRDALAGHLRLLEERESTPCVYHLFPVRVPERERFAARLSAAGIEHGVHYAPALHDQPALQGVATAREPLRRAERWAAEELSLPMGPELRMGEIDRVIEACLDALGSRDGTWRGAAGDGHA
jgi:dTDP-3-amino-3,4,6-trideoxy-alpha-D-glucose transaminase